MSFVDQYESAGWLQVGGAFKAAFIGGLRDEFERQFNDGFGRSLEVGDERLMLSIKLVGPLLDPSFYANSILAMVLRQLLGDELVIDSITCVVAMPDAGEQHLHTDHPDLFGEQPEVKAMLRPYAVTVAIPLVDLTPETGTTRLFPGTHLGHSTQDAHHPYLAQGDCFLMDYRLRHQGTANRSGRPRPVLYLVYTRPWFTDGANFKFQPRINISPADLAGIPAEHRPLFRRLAGKGAMDLTEFELVQGTH